MVNLTIDGKSIEVPEGTTVIRAAEKAGIQIPRLCDHEELSPYGGCRLCLVEVEGIRSLQSSCTLPVSNKMVVHTDTERVKAARKFVLTLIFSERNHFCPYCQVSGGDCELQNAALREGMTYWPLQPNWQTYEVDASHPYLVIDHNRCILCRRCVRACGELAGIFTLGFEERGAQSMLVADMGVPLGESSCVGCGTCLQVCPTGAIIDRMSAYRGRETQVEHHNTICVGCSLGCGLDVLTRNNSIVRIEGNWNAEINDGIICKLGRFIPIFEQHERIRTPLVRRDGKLVAATWEQAMEAITKELKPLAGKTNDGLAALASTRLSAEDLHLFKSIFSDGIKAGTVTSTEEDKYTAAYSSFKKELGIPFEGKLDTLKTADCVVCFDFDISKSHEVIGFMVKRDLPYGLKLVVVDSEDNSMEDQASLVLKTKKDNYTELINGIASALVKAGLSKAETNMNAEKVLVSAIKATGISEEDFLKAGQIITQAKQPVFLYGKKIAGASKEALKALIELSRIAGVLTNQYSGLLSPKHNANSLSAALYDLNQPFTLNGQKAVYIAMGDDEPSQKLLQSLGKVPFLVVQASYTSQLTSGASVVLPVANWIEQEGHYLTFDGKLQKAEKILNPPDGIPSNHSVLNDLAGKLGLELKEKEWKDELL